MRNLMVVMVLLLVGIAGLGFYRGWFQLSTTGADQKPSATVTLDKAKIHEDEQEAKDKAKGFEQEAKDKLGGAVGTTKEPQRQP